MYDEWLSVAEYNGWYEVSNSGIVRSWKSPGGNSRMVTRRAAPKVLSPRLGKNGYYSVQLWMNNKGKTFNIHSLVAHLFIGPQPDGLEVCHNNGVYTDNVVTNLRYDTPVGNSLDRLAHGTHNRGTAHPNHKLVEDDVRAIRKLADQGIAYVDIAKQVGTTKSNVGTILSGQNWGWLE